MTGWGALAAVVAVYDLTHRDRTMSTCLRRLANRHPDLRAVLAAGWLALGYHLLRSEH
jgi:hypothetical protein